MQMPLHGMSDYLDMAGASVVILYPVTSTKRLAYSPSTVRYLASALEASQLFRVVAKKRLLTFSYLDSLLGQNPQSYLRRHRIDQGCH